MSDFPTANFSGSDDGLFTVGEIRHLMAAEFDRAVRYQYPLVFMAVGIDRLEHLQDLYGYESKSVILRSATDLLQSVSRSSDFLGCLVEDRVLILFPHTGPEGAAAIARRLLRGARDLKFDGDGHTLQITLSIGASHNQTVTPLAYDDLVRAGEAALVEARAGGGDRYVVREPSGLPEEPAVPRPGRAEAHEAVPAAGAAAALDESALFDRIRDYLVQQGDLPGASVDNLEKQLLTSVLRALRQERAAGEADGAGAENARQIELLERRIAKLSKTLSDTEETLKKVAFQQTKDSGVPSIYRSVQGLADDEPDAELKREMMAQIFRANLGLRSKPEAR